MNYNEKEYLSDVAVELDGKLASELRGAINGWAASIPYNPFDGLGDDIKLFSARRIYMYNAVLHSQYDTRCVERRYEPCYDKPVPPLKYADASQVDVWSFDLPRPEKYGDSTDCFRITGSQRVASCHSCGGQGKVVCDECRGEKKIVCSTCKGAGCVPRIIDCPTCHGNGYQVFYDKKKYLITYDSNRNPIYGYKDEARRVTCSKCRGEKKVQYGTEGCSTCHSTGRVECPTCRGNGKLVCKTCNGQGRLLHFMQIRRDLKYARNDRNSVSMSEPDYRQLLKLLSNGDYSPVDRFAASSDCLREDVSVLPFVGSMASKMVSSAHAAISDGTHIIFEELAVRRVPIMHVRYEWEGDDYDIYIVGRDKVAAAHSPVTEYAELLRDKTIRQVKRRNLYDADRNAEKLYHLSGENEAFWGLSEKIASKLRADLLFGGHFSILLAGMLSIPLNLWYYKYVSYAAPWVDLAGARSTWTWSIVPWVYTIAAMWGAYKLLHCKWGYVHEKLPAFLLRFAVGVLIGVAGMVVVSAAVAALHWLILPTVWETVGDIVLLPWRIVAGVFDILF